MTVNADYGNTAGNADEVPRADAAQPTSEGARNVREIKEIKSLFL